MPRKTWVSFGLVGCLKWFWALQPAELLSSPFRAGEGGWGVDKVCGTTNPDRLCKKGPFRRQRYWAWVWQLYLLWYLFPLNSDKSSRPHWSSLEVVYLFCLCKCPLSLFVGGAIVALSEGHRFISLRPILLDAALGISPIIGLQREQLFLLTHLRRSSWSGIAFPRSLQFQHRRNCFSVFVAIYYYSFRASK